MKKRFILLGLLIVVLITFSLSVFSLSKSHFETSRIIENNDNLSPEERSLLVSALNNENISEEDLLEAQSLLSDDTFFDRSFRIKRETAAFLDCYSDYDAVLSFIASYMPDYKERDYICIGIDGSLSETVRAYFATEPGGYLKLTDEINKSLASIKQSFSKMGFELDAIRIRDQKISFDSSDGQYSLVKLFDSANKRQMKNTKKALEKEFVLQEIIPDWFHANSKPI